MKNIVHFTYNCKLTFKRKYIWLNNVIQNKKMLPPTMTIFFLFNIFYNYEIYEKRLRRSELETEWLKEMLDKDKWKYIM